MAADVRVETERRQRALEADLAKAERARKEKVLAQRYHHIKFFGACSRSCFTAQTGLIAAYALLQSDKRSPAS